MLDCKHLVINMQVQMPLFHTKFSCTSCVSHQMTFDLMEYADKKISFVVSDNEADDPYSGINQLCQ